MPEPDDQLRMLQTILEAIARLFGDLMLFIKDLTSVVVNLAGAVFRWFFSTNWGVWFTSFLGTLGTLTITVLFFIQEIIGFLGSALTVLFPSIPWGTFPAFSELALVNYFLPLDVVFICLGLIIVYVPVCWGIRILKSILGIATGA